MTSVDAFVETNRQRLLDELFELLRIPSISTLPEHQPDVIRAAELVARRLRETGLENVEIIPTERLPSSTPIGSTSPASPPCSATATTTCNRPTR